MTNYEVTHIRIPTNSQEGERFEQWLEQLSTRGSELVTVMPSGRSDSVLGIFRSAQKGSIRWDSGNK